ncbi:PD-(D/E)XK nuclease family protein [Myxococcota bacterium]|nr:PD-(D/E)XK nuclease family protein [Myxococcota bacterium]MBU1900240.1 PD-(D/E)XK nuclease family protein [Myxococcota bacterium]
MKALTAFLEGGGAAARALIISTQPVEGAATARVMTPEAALAWLTDLYPLMRPCGDLRELVEDQIIRAQHAGRPAPAAAELAQVAAWADATPGLEVEPLDEPIFADLVDTASARPLSPLSALRRTLDDPTRGPQLRALIAARFDLILAPEGFPCLGPQAQVWEMERGLSAPAKALEALRRGKQVEAHLRLRFLHRAGQPLEGGRLAPRLAPKIAEVVAEEVAARVAEGATPSRCAIWTPGAEEALWLEAALQARGLQAALHIEHSVWATPLAHELLTLLVALAEPTPKRIRTALATSLIGLRAEALAALDAGDGEQAWSRWVDAMRQASAQWLWAGPGPAVRALSDKLGFVEALAARADRRVEDWLHLVERLYHLGGGPAALLPRLRALLATTPTGPADRLRPGGGVALLTTPIGAAYDHLWCPFVWAPVRPQRGAPLRLETPQGPIVDVRPDTKRRVAAEAQARQAQLETLRGLLNLTTQTCTFSWGAFPGAERGLLGHLLGKLPMTDDGALVAALGRRLPLASPPPPLTLASPPPSPPPPPLAFDHAWLRSSFSQMLRRASHTSDQIEDSEMVFPTGEARIDLADVFGGALLGSCLHRVLEDTPFSASQATLYTVIEREQRPFDWPTDRLAAGLYEALHAPLDETGFCLADIPEARRLNELDFMLPVEGGLRPHGDLSGEALAGPLKAYPGPDLPDQYADRLAALDFPPYHGFLKGSIDLVFVHEGRWYIADYKTNHLGERVADYHPSRLQVDMGRAHYILQAHLYLVALHRHLSLRLPGYDPHQHLGGSVYFFLRGMSPRYPLGTGICWMRTPPARILALAALFEGGAGRAIS